MKNILVITFLMITLPSISQQYTGHYTWKSGGKDGPFGKMIIAQASPSTVKCWLQLSSGAPGYHDGWFSNFIEIHNGKGEYKYDSPDAFFKCHLKFSFSSNAVRVQHIEGECNFGQGVSAEGVYSKKDSKPPQHSEIWNFYGEKSLITKIVSAKAYIHTHPQTSALTKIYFVKGDNVAIINREAGFIYTEYITSKGKFIYGWIKETDVEKN